MTYGLWHTYRGPLAPCIEAIFINLLAVCAVCDGAEEFVGRKGLALESPASLRICKMMKRSKLVEGGYCFRVER